MDVISVLGYNVAIMDEKIKINYVNEYYKKLFGERTLKICIDGGFTCPNRDGKCGTSGCIFCSERGSGEHLKAKSIDEQIISYFASYKAKRANKFILYFQNYSNTYDSLDNLKNKYDLALNTAINQAEMQNKVIVGLDIATRPDCITDEICSLIASYKAFKPSNLGDLSSGDIPTYNLHLSVELGLQTANNDIGNFINRGYKTEDFIDAVKLLNKYNIDVIAHMMIGLPNETHEDIKNTILLINSLDIKGLKVHSTYIVKNTKLEELYKEGKYTPITLEYYINELKFVIKNVRKDIIFHRISGDAPKDILVAPAWNMHKKLVLNKIM